VFLKEPFEILEKLENLCDFSRRSAGSSSWMRRKSVVKRMNIGVLKTRKVFGDSRKERKNCSAGRRRPPARVKDSPI